MKTIILMVMCSILLNAMDTGLGVNVGDSIEFVKKSEILNVQQNEPNSFEFTPILTWLYFDSYYFDTYKDKVTTIVLVGKPDEAFEAQEQVVRILEEKYGKKRNEQSRMDVSSNKIMIGSISKDNVIIAVLVKKTFIGNLLMVMFTDTGKEAK